jgi:hypothetical protein
MLFKGRTRVDNTGAFVDLTNIETGVVKPLIYEWAKKKNERDGVVPQVSRIPGFRFLFTDGSDHYFEADLESFVALMNS